MRMSGKSEIKRAISCKSLKLHIVLAASNYSKGIQLTARTARNDLQKPTETLRGFPGFQIAIIKWEKCMYKRFTK